VAQTVGEGTFRGIEAEAFDPVDRVLAFVERFVALDDGDRQLIRKLTRIERYPKGTVLLAAGKVARESWLVIQGCVRSFHGSPPDDQTLAFYTEFHPVSPPTIGTEAPSPVTFECLEDVVASASTAEEEARGLKERPRFESICRVMGEALMANLQQAQIEILTRTPQQRYLDLVARRPDLLQRVPQYHIATFLQIRPETLSRIRRRLSRRREARR
jgi:CRP-like cAMP-binding protein